MTNHELAAALRNCEKEGHCDTCPARDSANPFSAACIAVLQGQAANALENAENHVMALRKEIETLRAQLTTVQHQNEQLREANALTVKATTDRLCREWVSVKERLPDREEDVLVLVSGKFKNCTFDHAYMIGIYAGPFGWILNEYPEWENPGVTHWMPLPEPLKAEVVRCRDCEYWTQDGNGYLDDEYHCGNEDCSIEPRTHWYFKQEQAAEAWNRRYPNENPETRKS